MRHLKIVQQRVAKAGAKSVSDVDNLDAIEEAEEPGHETAKYLKDNQDTSGESEKYKDRIDEPLDEDTAESKNIPSGRKSGKENSETYNNDRERQENLAKEKNEEYKKKAPVKSINSEPVFTGDFVAEASTTFSQQKQRTVVQSHYTNSMPHIPKPGKRRQNILSSHDLDEVSLS